ncbi:MAG: SgcJ/EcaC family oxidoreductase [Chloroflexi bacterium]|nr:SgcJ/EcaC family oxidoreductase [Chloroflexota bacterium]
MSESTRDDTRSSDEQTVGDLYQQLLQSWNQRDAAAFAALFTADAHLVGFDGSMVDGQAAIEEHLRQIFTDHPTAAYVGKIREIRLLAPDVVLLRAVAGMVPPGQADLLPAANTIQALVAVREAATWRITFYQNTPAQFHGRPELVQQLADELRLLLFIRPVAPQ